MSEENGDVVEPSIDANDPAVKALIEKAVSEATSGLVTKRDELLSEKKALKADLDSVKAKFEGIDPEAVRELLSEKEKSKEDEAKQKGDWEKILEARDTKHATQIESIQAELGGRAERAEAFARKLVKDVALAEALREAKILPQFQEAASVLLANEIKIKDDEGSFSAFAEIDEREMGVNEFVRLWSESDKGKHFVQAPANSGGGSTNGKGNGSGSTTVNPFKAGSVNLTQQGQILKSDPNKARQLIREAGAEPAKYGL